MEDSLSVGVVFHHEPMQRATQDSECGARGQRSVQGEGDKVQAVWSEPPLPSS